MSYNVLTEHLTIEQMQELSKNDPNGYIEGVISFDLKDAIDNDFEGFLDIISEALTGTDILMDLNYSVVGAGPDGSIHLKVSGDPSSILGEEDDD